MTLKSNFFLLLIGVAVLLSSCGSNKAKVLIDNPTNKAIVVGFDNGFKKTVGPYKTEMIQFENMNASLTVDGNDVGEIFLSPGQEYILNPTFSTYLIEKIMYGDNAMASMLQEMMAEKEGKTSNSILPLKSIKVDTFDYFGYVQSTNALLIDRIWDIDMTENVPNQIEVGTYDQSASLIKLFRKYEFIRFHKLGQEQQ